MEASTTIRKLLALLVLLVFAFSITPKKYFHDWIADHTDYYSPGSSEADVVHGSGYNCHCQDQVISTPFIELPETGLQTPPAGPGATHASFYHFLFSGSDGVKDSRGPPALA